MSQNQMSRDRTCVRLTIREVQGQDYSKQRTRKEMKWRTSRSLL